MNFQWDMFLTKFDGSLEIVAPLHQWDMVRPVKILSVTSEIVAPLHQWDMIRPVKILSVTSEIVAPLHPKRTVSWL